MTLSLHLIRIIKGDDPVIIDVEEKVVNKSPRKQVGEVIQETVKVAMSPGTIRRNLSADNFLKFQWAWTV